MTRLSLTLALAATLAVLPVATSRAQSGGGTLTYVNVLRLRNTAASGQLAPVVRIVSPFAGANITPGASQVGAGSPDGTGFALNLEVVTRDATPLVVREATLAPPVFGVRHVPELEQGLRNPDVPGLYVFFDCDLITPNGTILPKGTNFASAFNVAGSDDTPGPGMTLWLGWHVLESIPASVNEVTITVAFVDAANRIGFDQIKVRVDRNRAVSAQALTPAVGTFPGGPGVEDPAGPEVSMIAPRVPTAIAAGPQGAGLTANNGSLKFIQVTAVDRSGAGIAVNETGIRPGNTLPFGLIFDPSQIPNPSTNGGVGGPNRNFPGLNVSFDVPLRQPNGNVVAAGVNLAPLFDVVGSEIDAQSGAVRVTADWVVGGSLLMPTGKQTVTITTRVTDNQGRAGVTKSILPVSAFTSGQDMSLNP